MPFLEVANALLVGERAPPPHHVGRDGTVPSDPWCFSVTVDDQTVAHAWADTMHLAGAHNLSSYDAAYLELAIRLGLPLAALDGKLENGSRGNGCTALSRSLRLPLTLVGEGTFIIVLVS